MKTYTRLEAKGHIISEVQGTDRFAPCDNDGQIVIYTGLYMWADGSIRDSAEPDPNVCELCGVVYGEKEGCGPG